MGSLLNFLFILDLDAGPMGVWEPIAQAIGPPLGRRSSSIVDVVNVDLKYWDVCVNYWAKKIIKE